MSETRRHQRRFELELHNRSLRDPEMGRRGLDWCDQLLARFSGDDFQRAVRRQKADLLLASGDEAGGVAVFEALRNEDPDDAMPYVLLAEWYGSTVRNPSPDRERAIETLERALARPVRNANDWDLEHRLADLRRGR